MVVMSVSPDHSDSESVDSDAELQEAFRKGELKQGLNLALPAPRKVINNVAGMKRKLEELKVNLEWLERLDLTNAPAPSTQETMVTDEDELVNDDFKRELRFYRQAQATVLEGIPKLHKAGILTKRPEDYFAEMAKSDDQMKRVREKLLEKQNLIDRREKAKKLRELRKYGKKVQHEVLQKRQKEKKEMLDAVKKFRKGQKDKLDFMNELENPSQNKGSAKRKTDKPNIINKKREYKNKKFGFGGQKKRSKMNTAESSADMTSFNRKVHQSKAGGGKKGKGKSSKQGRPGKSKRQKMKSNKGKHR